MHGSEDTLQVQVMPKESSMCRTLPGNIGIHYVYTLFTRATAQPKFSPASSLFWEGEFMNARACVISAGIPFCAEKHPRQMFVFRDCFSENSAPAPGVVHDGYQHSSSRRYPLTDARTFSQVHKKKTNLEKTACKAHVRPQASLGSLLQCVR